MNFLTVKQVAERTGLSTQTVRKLFPVVKFGRSVRIDERELNKFFNRRALAAIHGDAGLSNAMNDYRVAESVIEHLDPDPDARADPDVASLLASTISAYRIERPEWGGHVIGVGETVLPPAIAFIKARLPQGGGAKGGALRALIEAA